MCRAVLLLICCASLIALSWGQFVNIVSYVDPTCTVAAASQSYRPLMCQPGWDSTSEFIYKFFTTDGMTVNVTRCNRCGTERWTPKCFQSESFSIPTPCTKAFDSVTNGTYYTITSFGDYPAIGNNVSMTRENFMINDMNGAGQPRICNVQAYRTHTVADVCFNGRRGSCNNRGSYVESTYPSLDCSGSATSTTLYFTDSPGFQCASFGISGPSFTRCGSANMTVYGVPPN